MWVVTFCLSMLVIFGLADYAKGHELFPTVRGFYAAVNRTVWGLVVAVVIYMCLQGYGGTRKKDYRSSIQKTALYLGFVNKILSWKIWIPFSRLTFCAYLIHPPVVIYYFAILEKPEHITHYGQVRILV